MTSDEARSILRELLAERLTPVEAAKRLLAASGAAGAGLTLDLLTLPAEERARAERLLPALHWEVTRLLLPGQVPDVAFDAPEARAWREARTAPRPGLPGVARFLPPDAVPGAPS